jgi:hypothetical protein
VADKRNQQQPLARTEDLTTKRMFNHTEDNQLEQIMKTQNPMIELVPGINRRTVRSGKQCIK